MKKLFTVLLLFGLSVSINAQFSSNWELKGGTNPSWNKSSGARGIAFGNIAGNKRLYVAYAGTNIKILNADNGAEVGDLSVSGTTEATRKINIVKVAGNKIYACNLVNAVAFPFKVYMWNDETSAPSVVLSYDAPTCRLGDQFSVIGSYADGTAVIYAAIGNSNVVLRWTQTGPNQNFNSTPETYTLPTGYSSWGTPAYAVPVSDETNSKFWASGRSIGTVKEYNTNLSATGYVSESGIAALEYFQKNAQEYLIMYIPGSFCAKVRAINPASSEKTDRSGSLYGASPALGAVSAGGLGDVAHSINSDGTITVYVLCTNNGIGAYTTNAAPLPVELSSFTSAINGSSVMLSWKTATEQNSYMFEVERSDNGSEFEKVGEVNAHGNSNTENSYSFEDASLQAGSYVYRLKMVDNDGTYEYSSELSVNISTPREFSLMQNFPNPFNPSTTIKFNLPVDSRVSLTIYDAVGREIAVLVNGDLSAGEHSYPIDARRMNLSSGVYFFTLRSADFQKTMRMTLLK